MPWRVGLLSAMVVMLSGCSWLGSLFDDDDEQVDAPTELTDFTPTARMESLWSHGIGDQGGEQRLGLGLTVANGDVYAGNYDGDVYAYRAENGREHWEAETDLPLSAGPGAGEGLVVFGSMDGDVIALDAETGNEQWRTRVSSEILAAPVVDRERVIVYGVDGRVHGLDKKDGSSVWVYDRDQPVLTVRGNGKPLLRAGTVLIGHDSGKIIALRAEDGIVQWEATLAEPRGKTELERLVDVDGNMVAIAAEVYAVSYHGRLSAISLTDGQMKWVRDFSSYQGLSVAKTQLFMTDADDVVWALDRRNGASLWAQQGLKFRQLTAPEPILSWVAVADFEGFVHLLDQEDGSIAARDSMGGISLPGFGDPVPVRIKPEHLGDLLFVLNSDGNLAAWRIAAK